MRTEGIYVWCSVIGNSVWSMRPRRLLFMDCSFALHDVALDLDLDGPGGRLFAPRRKDFTIEFKLLFAVSLLLSKSKFDPFYIKELRLLHENIISITHWKERERSTLLHNTLPTLAIPDSLINYSSPVRTTMTKEANDSGTSRAAADPATVHRILLTDPAEFSSLTVSGVPRMTETPTFDEYRESLQPPSGATGSSASGAAAAAIHNNDIKNVTMQSIVQGAAVTALVERLQSSQNIEPAVHLLLELHEQLRRLIPNRRDLHSLLSDESVRAATGFKQLLAACVKAAQALIQLESPARVATTEQWIQSVKSQTIASTASTTTTNNSSGGDDWDADTVAHTVVSMFYLLYKTQLCVEDKQDFMLGHVTAPQIFRQGRALEHAHFQARFGQFGHDQATAPATRQWIQSLVVQQKSSPDTSSSSSSLTITSHRDLVAVGWIRDIMFRGPELPALNWPEILALDVENLSSLRKVTALAAAGSTVALHVRTTAGRQSTDETTDESTESTGYREALVQAMTEQWRPDYEETVGDAAVALARHYYSSCGEIDEAACQSLRNRVGVVLRGQDPVLKLLDGRMKECFCQLALRSDKQRVSSSDTQQQQQQQLPATLKTGHGSVADGNSKISSDKADPFLQEANRLFCNRGLASYAVDLAAAAKLGIRVIDLAWTLYGDVLLEGMIHDAKKAL